MNHSKLYNLFMKDVLGNHNTIEYWINNVSTVAVKMLLNDEYYYLRKENTHYILSDEKESDYNSANVLLLSLHGKKLQIDNMDDYKGKLSSYLRENVGLFAKQKVTQKLINEKVVKISAENRRDLDIRNNHCKTFSVDTDAGVRTYYFMNIPADIKISHVFRSHTELTYSPVLFLLEKRVDKNSKKTVIHTDFEVIDADNNIIINIVNALDKQVINKIPEGLQLYLACIKKTSLERDAVLQKIYNDIEKTLEEQKITLDEFFESSDLLKRDVVLAGHKPLAELINEKSDNELKVECSRELVLEMVKAEGKFAFGQSESLRELKIFYGNMTYSDLPEILKDYYILKRYHIYTQENGEQKFLEENRFYLDRLLYIKRLPIEEKIQNLLSLYNTSEKNPKKLYYEGKMYDLYEEYDPVTKQPKIIITTKFRSGSIVREQIVDSKYAEMKSAVHQVNMFFEEEPLFPQFLDEMMNRHFFLIGDEERKGHKERAWQAYLNRTRNGGIKLTRAELTSALIEGKYVSFYNFKEPQQTCVKLLKLGKDGRIYQLKLSQTLNHKFHSINIEREPDAGSLRRHYDKSVMIEQLRKGLIPLATSLTHARFEDVLEEDTGQSTYTIILPEFIAEDIAVFWEHEKERVLVHDNDDNMMKLYNVFKYTIGRREPIVFNCDLEYFIISSELDTFFENHYLRVQQNHNSGDAEGVLLYNISCIREMVKKDENEDGSSRIYYKLVNVAYDSGRVVPCEKNNIITEKVNYPYPKEELPGVERRKSEAENLLKLLSDTITYGKASADNIKTKLSYISFTQSNPILDAMFAICDINEGARDYFVGRKEIKNDATVEELFSLKCPHLVKHAEDSNVLFELLKQDLWIKRDGATNFDLEYAINEQDAYIVDTIVNNAKDAENFEKVVERTIEVLKGQKEDGECLYSTTEVMERLERKIHQELQMLKPISDNVISTINNMFEVCTDEAGNVNLYCLDTVRSCFYKNDLQMYGAYAYNGGYGDIYESDAEQNFRGGLDEPPEEQRVRDVIRGRMSSYWD